MTSFEAASTTPFNNLRPLSEMSIKELKLAVSNTGLTSLSLGFLEKRDFINLLEGHLDKIGPDAVDCPGIYITIVFSLSHLLIVELIEPIENLVCYTEITLSIKSFLPQCHHLICDKCFVQVHRYNSNCPLCRRAMPKTASTMASDATAQLATAAFTPQSPERKAELEGLSEENLRAALALDPYDISCLTTLADLVLERDEEEAFSLCCRAICEHPEVTYGYSTMAHVHEKRGHIVEAKTCYLQALNLNSEDAGSLSNLGTLYFQEGNVLDAVRCHRRAVALKPNDFTYTFNLAVTLEEGDVDLDEAITLYTRALSLDSFGMYRSAVEEALSIAEEKRVSKR